MDATANEVRAFARGYASAVEAHCLSLLRRLEELHVQHRYRPGKTIPSSGDGALAVPCLCRRNHLHLQRAQLQQALLDIRGGVDFAERLLTCGSDAQILSTKGVTLRRLSGLAEGGLRPASVAPDNSSGIEFAASEPAGRVEGFPVVGVIVSKAVDVGKCTIEGEGRGSSWAFGKRVKAGGGGGSLSAEGLVTLKQSGKSTRKVLRQEELTLLIFPHTKQQQRGSQRWCVQALKPFDAFRRSDLQQRSVVFTSVGKPQVRTYLPTAL